MSTFAQKMGIGTTTQPAPAPVEEDREPSPFKQTLPGVFVDFEKAAEMGYEEPQFDGVFDALKQFFTGELIGKQPPLEATSISRDVINPLGIGGEAYDRAIEKLIPGIDVLTTEETAAARARSKDEFDELVIKNLQSQAQQFGVNVAPNSTIVADLIREKSEDMGLVEGQDQLYLADNQAEYTNALENIFGEGNVRVLPYDGPYFSTFSPEYYVSVRENADAEFTDFAPTVVSFKDYVDRVAPGLLAETTAAVGMVPGALLFSGAVSAATGPAAVITGPLSFVYALYVQAKGVETARQYIKDELDLTDEEAVQFSGVLDAAYQMMLPQIQGITVGDDVTPAQMQARTQREIAGSLEILFATVPGLATKMRLAIGRVTGREDTKRLFQSAIRAQENVAETAPGGSLDIGVQLEPLMLQQVTPDLLVSRVSALASQTSLVIPGKTRDQMQTLIQYIETYKDDLGAGNFAEFQQAVADVGQTLQTLKDAPDGTIPDLSTIGENLDSLDELFLKLRGFAARGLYNNVFDKLKNASYNLDDVREIVQKDMRSILPVSAPDATAKDALEAAVPSPKRGEGMLAPLIDDVMSLGKVQKDGSRLLTPDGVRAAVRKFQQENPNHRFDPADINSPAELLQLYASRFGKLARDTFSTSGASPDPELFGQAVEMRRALLELIGNPREEALGEAVAADLKKANDFYTETFRLSSTPLQVQARNTRRSALTPEPAVLPEAVATTPAGTGRVAPSTVTMENIVDQERYVREFLDNPDNLEALRAEAPRGQNIDPAEEVLETGARVTGAATQLQEYFINVLASKLRRGMPTDVADTVAPEEVVKFLDSFEPRQLRALGLTEEMEATIRNDATLLAKMQQGQTLTQVLMMPRKSQVADVFEDVLQSGTTSDLRIAFDQLDALIRRAEGPAAKAALRENLRGGLLDHIFSRQGAYVEVTSPSAYGDIGDFTLSAPKLFEIIDKLKKVGAFEPGGVLGPDDSLKVQPEKFLEVVAEYAGVITPSGADAGSALAGAQIIGEMFTIKPEKFIAGLARLGSQSRIAKLLAKDEFVKLVTGTGKPMSRVEKFKLYFRSKNSLASIIAKLASEELRPEDEQTDAMLTNEVDSNFARKLGLYGSYP